MINERELINELLNLGHDINKHLITAERGQEEMFAFAIKNQSAMLQNVIKRINAQPKVYVWIPCSERLPEDSKRILICQGNGYVSEGRYRAGAGFEFINRWPCKHVTAWQPLPRSYDPGEQEAGQRA